MSILVQTLKGIFINSNLTKVDKITKAEDILLKGLEKEPYNTDIYFKLAVIILEEPEVDFIGGINHMQTVLSFNPSDAEAALFLSWIHYYHRGYVDSETLALLDNYLADDERDSLIRSLCYLSTSWGMELETVKRERLLEKSIEVNNTYVSNYLELADLHDTQGNYKKKKELIMRALQNVEYILPVDDSFNIQDFQKFKGSNFKGICKTIDVPNYDHFRRKYILNTIMDSYRLKVLLTNL